ncbi:hypothetical protein ACS0TY_008910 [Phlomoides rotata]
MADKPPPPPPLSSSKPPPTITLPPRNLTEKLFIAAPGASPGPMSLVSSFFAENDRSVSFSELLAGAMSPEDGKRNSAPPDSNGVGDGGNRSGEFRFQQDNLMVSNPQGTVTIPPVVSPASLLDSPDFFSSLQGAFGMPHQQFLSQAQPHMQMQHPSSAAASVSSLSQLQPLRPNAQQQTLPPLPDPKVATESSDISHSDQKFQPPNITVDKPTDDGYNWRKYGQKQVKGSEFPRSYYKCTHSNCSVKKKVERSLDGQITEIIYKGQHNHPQPSKRTRENGNTNGTLNTQGNSEFGSESQTGNFKPEEAKNQGSHRVTPENVSGSSGSDGVGNTGTRGDERDEDEPEFKRSRNVEVQNPEQASNPRTVTEPRIIVQTTSEVDLLDDGYRWRKYGQKVVKGNPYPRSYYKCTSAGCNVRKHVERAATDPKAVITTYEGKHNHDVPAARNSSHSNAASQLRPQNSVVRPVAKRGTEFANEQRSVALLQFKEEQTS